MAVRRQTHGGELGRRPLDARAIIVGGLTYPAWYWIAPGPNDPWLAWAAIAAALVGFGSASGLGWVSGRAQNRITPAVSGLVTLHFMLLAHANGMQSFYAVGSSMAMMMSVLFIRSETILYGYAGFACSVAIVLYAIDPDPLKLAFWAGPIPVFGFAYTQIRNQAALERELERQVEERTRALTEANRRLREASETRSRLEKELRVQHKVEAVGRLAGGVAHDFNNLLTTIGIYADLVHDGLAPESELREEIRYIQQAQRQATALTQELLTLGRRSHARLEVIDLNQVIREHVALLRRILDDRHELIVSLNDGSDPIRGNIDQLQRIILNLALNAADAMPSPGRLTLETARVTREKMISMSLASPFEEHAEFVCFSVQDTGIGMTPEARDRAFDPFFTTKSDRGSGLGLSIVHGIVSQAGGYVRLASEAGRGARFELYWPIERPTEHTEVPPEVTRGLPAGSRILLVDDEVALRTAVQRVLSTAGCIVTEAGDGQEALETARREEFDLVISDAVMPRMGGVELADHLRNERPELRILIMSAHLNDESLKKVAPDLPFLAKPFAPKEFLEQVEILLGATHGPGDADLDEGHRR